MSKQPYRTMKPLAISVVIAWRDGDDCDAAILALGRHLGILKTVKSAKEPKPLHEERGRPHRLSPRTMEILETIQKGGRTFADIGMEYGLSRERIRQTASYGGITAKDIRHTLSPTVAELNRREADAQRDALAEFLTANRRRDECQKKLKTPRAPIVTDFPKGCAPRHSSKMVEQARSLWDEGKSAQKIAMELTSEERVISKNVIIGLAYRNKFPRRAPPGWRNGD
jgi:Sigma-70, region 4